MSILTTFLTGSNQGLLWAVMAIGVYISYRLLDFADLTVDGSFATGGSTAAIIVTSASEYIGESASRGMFIAIVALLAAVVSGGFAGLITGLLNTKLKIAPILSGIITMTGLYSVNMFIMGIGTGSLKSNLGMGSAGTLFTFARKIMPISLNWIVAIVAIIVVAIVMALLYWFCGTEIGSAMRATGNNEKMAKAQGINTQNSKILGLVLSNALVGLSGALVAFQQSNASVTMGVGAIVAGLAAIIIGESIIPDKFPFWARLLSLAIGSIIYRVIIAYIYWSDIDAEYVKLVTAVLVVLALCIPLIKDKIRLTNIKNGKTGNKKSDQADLTEDGAGGEVTGAVQETTAESESAMKDETSEEVRNA